MKNNVRILIVDDEEPMRRLLSYHLQQAGYETEEADSGKEAILKVSQHQYQCILLDIMMPVIDGWQTCYQIREISSVPVIMLTARDHLTDKVKGLQIGADDYITKPFNKEELLARVHAVLRRNQQVLTAHIESQTGVLSHRGIHLHPKQREVFFQEQLLMLTRTEYEMLHLFLKHPGRVFSREDLLALIWSDLEIEDFRTVDSHIKNLREKLRIAGALAHDIIKTIWGVGYKLQ
ncbi:response regulator transcription factor [Hazenella coriacea]|uniref:DNA-binding response OmpR family regulator n=1 Tax=Hazenella coriacea TaxID=1179467 RepID=A0A4R3L721_9BACL|nr:response regulator transcription factor [Hazenella coriacea]TCS94825.1 DNA-binding response OmpR family regulator [Hazenella coriacea]